MYAVQHTTSFGILNLSQINLDNVYMNLLRLFNSTGMRLDTFDHKSAVPAVNRCGCHEGVLFIFFLLFFFISCCNSFTYPAVVNIFGQHFFFFLLQLLQLQFLQSELKMIYIGLEGMTNRVGLVRQCRLNKLCQPTVGRRRSLFLSLRQS